MAQEAPQQLAYILLVLLASGSRAQDIRVHRTPEGKGLSVTCQYRPDQQSMLKIWCWHTPAGSCTIIVDSSHRESKVLRSSMTIHPQSNRFTVTMKELRVKDTGFYSCVVWDHYLTSFTTLQTIHLGVFKASTTAAPRRTRMTAVPASATSPVFESPPTSTWKFIVAAVVATGLLLGLAGSVALCLKKSRGRAGKGQKGSHHVYDDIAVQKEEPPGSGQQSISGEDAGTICYASIVHLNPRGFQDSIYANTNPAWRPTPDPLLSVEYTTIAGGRRQLSLSSTPEEAARDQRQSSPSTQPFPNAH